MGELCLQNKSKSRMLWKPPDTTLSNAKRLKKNLSKCLEMWSRQGVTAARLGNHFVLITMYIKKNSEVTIKLLLYTVLRLI